MPYAAKVFSMLSKQTAEPKLNVQWKTIIDSHNDWIEKLTGKIQHKEAK